MAVSGKYGGLDVKLLVRDPQKVTSLRSMGVLVGTATTTIGQAV